MAALSGRPSLSQGRGRGQEAHEVGREIKRLLVDLRVGGGIDPRGNWPSTDRFLGRDGRIRDALLDDECARVEFAQRRYECLAPEPTDASIHKAVYSPGNPVMVPVIGISIGDDVRVGHGIEQTTTENRQRRSEAAPGGVLGEGLLVETQGSLERGCCVLLDDGAALVGERIAVPVGVECGGVYLHLLAASSRHGILVALPAGGGVEERAKPRFGCEDTVEDRPAAPEPVALFGGQTRDRIAWVHGLRATARDEGDEKEDRCGRRRPHRGPTFSIRSAMSCLPDQWHCTRTMSPRFSALNGTAASPAGGATRCTIRRDMPTPVTTSKDPVFGCNAWTVP